MSLTPFKRLEPGTKLAFTGHRPPRLGGYDQRVYSRLLKLATEVLTATQPTEVISGMALGWDTEVALAAIQLGIPVTAAVPFDGFDALWPMQSQDRFRKILTKCANVHYVSPPGYQSYKLHMRNRWMCDNGDVLCSLWDGEPTGGTARCVQYAESIDMPIMDAWGRYYQMLMDEKL